MSLLEITLGVVAYLFGSISSAIIIARLMKLPDPRTEGSGNPGATNMLRVGGKKAAALTLAGDMLKGVIPVMIGHLANVSMNGLMLIAFLAFIGHLYPVFFGFKGGKGVATALGVLIAGVWQIGLFTVGVWLFMAFVVRISSLSALTAFALTPVFAFLMKYDNIVVITVTAIAVILIWRHRSNIQKLLAGTEGKLDNNKDQEE